MLWDYLTIQLPDNLEPVQLVQKGEYQWSWAMSQASFQLLHSASLYKIPVGSYCGIVIDPSIAAYECIWATHAQFGT